MVVYQGVFPISGEDLSALPVQAIGPAAAFYQSVLGFSVSFQDDDRATVERDGAKLGLVRNPDHKPGEAGSCYFSVSDVDAARAELAGKDADIGAIRIDHHEGKRFRVFFLREDRDGYCYCFGTPVE